MRTITEWSEFVDSIGPHLASPQPIQALEQSGVALGGAVARAFAGRTPERPLDPGLLPRLLRSYGPAPQYRLHMGRRRPPPTALARAGGFRAIISAEISSLNSVLAELWRVKTIPNELSQSEITISTLLDACTGVPDGASLAPLQLTQPPVISASTQDARSLHVDVSFNLPLQGAAAPSLMGTVQAEIKLDFAISASNMPGDPPTALRIRLLLDAINGLTATLVVNPLSALQPRSEAKRALLEDKFATALRKILIELSWDKKTLTLPGDIGISSSFPNSRVRVTQIGAVSVRSSRDFIIAGINVDNLQFAVDPSALTSEELPASPNNVHVVVDQDFASDALDAAITSGDLAAFFNRVIQRHSLGLTPPPVVVNSGNVAFDTNLLRVTLDCTLQDACVGNKDLGFTATVTGTPVIADGSLTIEASEVDFDLDDWDAVVCAILGAFLGPFGLLLTLVAEILIAALNPNGKNLEFATEETSDPLPGSEKDLQIRLTGASVVPGAVRADGVATVIPDTTHTFIYLRLTSGVTARLAEPLRRATVELLELDNPAPAGDDVAIPPTGLIDERVVGRFIFDTDGSYQPTADQSLGTAVTDDSGYVRLVVTCNTIAGTYTVTKTKSDAHTAQTITRTQQRQIIGETEPDFGITVVDSLGTVLATRKLIALNVVGRRLGTKDNPFVVFIGERPVNRPEIG